MTAQRGTLIIPIFIMSCLCGGIYGTGTRLVFMNTLITHNVYSIQSDMLLYLVVVSNYPLYPMNLQSYCLLTEHIQGFQGLTRRLNDTFSVGLHHLT